LVTDDSTNAVAHLVLGAIQLDLYRGQKDRVSIPVRYADDNVMDLVIGYLDPRREDGRDLGIVRDVKQEAAYATNAERHLRNALRGVATPIHKTAAWRLAELAVLIDAPGLGQDAARKFRSAEPTDPWGYALEALFAQVSGERSVAWNASVTTLDYMTMFDRTVILDRSHIQVPSDPRSGRDWLDDDPRWETPENERLVEHLARQTTLRLLGYPVASDPGQLILRYGMPDESVRFSTDRDDFLAMSYPFSTFIFHDMAKTGDWIFWSSSAADLTGPRNVIRQWQRDQTIHAAEQFAARPFRSATGPAASIALEAAVFGFGPRGDREWVVGWCPDLREDRRWDDIQHVGLYAAGTDSLSVTDSTTIPVPVRVDSWTTDLVRPDSGMAGPEAAGWCLPVFRHVRTAASHERFSLEMRDSQGRVGAVRVRTAPTPDTGPVMSDLLLARVVADVDASRPTPPEGFIRRGDRLIEPLLPAVVYNGSSIAVYFEIHDMSATARIEAVLTPADDRDQAAVSVSFTEEVSGEIWARDIILDLDGVKSGAYHLTVRVADIQGNLPVLERSTSLELVSR
jgi:hypothetical protein